MAQVVPELIYRSLLQQGILWLKQNLLRIDNMMSGYSLADIASIRSYIQTHDITIVQGWPRENTPFPCIAIILMQEGETPYIDEAIGMVDDETQSGIISGRLWNAEHLLMVVSDNADLTVTLYQLLKLTLQRFNESLNEYLHEIAFDGGDIQPQLNFLPDHLYTRGMSIRASYFDSVIQEFSPVKVSRVLFNLYPEGTAPEGEGMEDPTYTGSASTPGIAITSVKRQRVDEGIVVVQGTASSTVDLSRIAWTLVSGDTVLDQGDLTEDLGAWVVVTVYSTDSCTFSARVVDAAGNVATSSIEYQM
jgi:hypothetical protein